MSNSKKKFIQEKVLVESGERPIYKEYEYPDGRILRLTKEEFDAIADVFIMLAEQHLRNEKEQKKDNNG